MTINVDFSKMEDRVFKEGSFQLEDGVWKYTKDLCSMTHTTQIHYVYIHTHLYTWGITIVWLWKTMSTFTNVFGYLSNIFEKTINFCWNRMLDLVNLWLKMDY